MVCVNKTLYKCSTFRITIDDSGAEEENIETPIYTNIKCYILKVYNKDFSQELALETDKSNILLRV
jgi:catabolite regulation protein CreA